MGWSVTPISEEFSTVCGDPQKCFGVGNKAEVDAFLELSCFESAALNISANLENSSVDTGLEGQFSFQSHRKAMPKNVQTPAQIHSSHTLAK